MGLTLLAVTYTGLGALLGAALLSWRTRVRFRRTPGAFSCKVRLPDQPRRARTGFRRDWGRRRTWAVWVHDVLLIRRGLFGHQVVALPVRIPEDGPRVALGGLRGLGPDPYRLTLRLDGGPLIDVAVPGHAQELAVGPFLAAAIPGLPAAPADRRRHRH